MQEKTGMDGGWIKELQDRYVNSSVCHTKYPSSYTQNLKVLIKRTIYVCQISRLRTAQMK